MACVKLAMWELYYTLSPCSLPPCYPVDAGGAQGESQRGASHAVKAAVASKGGMENADEGDKEGECGELPSDRQQLRHMASIVHDSYLDCQAYSVACTLVVLLFLPTQSTPLWHPSWMMRIRKG
jgi:hypothetical protein